MKRFLASIVLLSLILPSAWPRSAIAGNGEVGSYPNATSPLNGTERILADQSSSGYPCTSCTVNITPLQLSNFTAAQAASFGLLFNNAGAIGGLAPTATGQYCLDWASLTADPTLVTCSTAATAFSAITAGTNTAALVMGTGGSLTASGGTIDATSVGGFTLPCTVPSLVSGDYLTNNGSTCSWAAVSGSGTVTSFSFTNGGGINGTVATATTTPALSLTPSFTGLSYATSGTGFAAATASNVLSLVNSQSCNAQTGTTYTFVIGDANNCVTMSNAAANTVTVPANASVAFPVGTTLTVIQDGAGATTLQGAGSPVTLTSAKYGSSTTQTYVFSSEYSCVSLQKTATDTWFVSSCDYNPGGGSGTVTDGSGTTTANELLASTTTAHTYSVVTTLPTAAMPALTGDLTGTAGSLSVTVNKVNGGAIPASASVLASNSSSQIIAATTTTYLIDSGTAFTLGTGTGACATDSVVHAGAANGEVTCTGTTGASTLVVNMPTTTNGWTCTATDITQKAMVPESAFTVSTVTFSGTITANDNIVIQCTGF